MTKFPTIRLSRTRQNQNLRKLVCETKLSIADLYKIQGIVSRRIKDYSLAEDYFLTSLRINRELKNELNFAETSFELGILYNDLKDVEKAKPYLLDALKFYKKVKSKTEIAKIEEYLR